MDLIYLSNSKKLLTIIRNVMIWFVDLKNTYRTIIDTT